jgi:hypothetical protein
MREFLQLVMLYVTILGRFYDMMKVKETLPDGLNEESVISWCKTGRI